MTFLPRSFAPHAAKGWVPARLFRETSINSSASSMAARKSTPWSPARFGTMPKTTPICPPCGDWVAVELGKENADHVIRARLPRKSRFSRKAPGKSVREQVIAANIDIVAVVTDAGADDNLRRIERYFALDRPQRRESRGPRQ